MRPKKLVVTGLYRYVRNPMYVGVLLLILGWASLYNSRGVLQYAVLVWAGFYIWILTYEEPALKRQFGESYKNYCKEVRRWISGRGYKLSA